MTAEERDAPSPTSWTVPPEAAGERLDRHVAAHLDVPRNQVQAWIRDGRVEVDGRPAARPSLEIAAGGEVRCAPPAPHEDRVQPEEGPLAVLYEDTDLAVLDKPPGLTVHPERANRPAPWPTACSPATRRSPASAAPAGRASSTASTATPAAPW